MRYYLHILIMFSAVFITNISYCQWGDCDNSIEACTNPSFAVTPNGFGNIEEFQSGTTTNPSSNPNAAPGNSGCLLSGELNSTWLLITVTSPGTLEFSMGDLASPGCFDWIMWPYDANACDDIFNNVLPPIACNWNGACSGLTGMANILPAGASQADFENELNVNAGDQFMICLSNYGGANSNIPLNFFGTAGTTCGGAIGATICEGDTATISALDGVTYVWETAIFGFITTNAAGDTAYVNPSITTSYPVVITFADGTSANDTCIVTVIPAINAIATVIEDQCFGDDTASITIATPGGTAPFTFELTGPTSSNNTNGIFSNLPSGNYTIDITDDTGCSDQIILTVNAGPLCCDITISTTGDSVNCQADCSGMVIVDTANSHPPVNIQWFDENNNPIIGAFNDTLFSVCTGTYYVEVSDIVCMKRDTATVGISLQLPTAISSTDTIISVDQEIPLWTSGGSSYVWTPDTYLDCSDCDNPISTPGDDITYLIAVTDSLGCSVEDTIVVTVIYYPLFIPNGFSPNNDNENDILYVRGGGIASIQMHIFDKWGNLVFETLDIEKGWDGTFNGKPVNTGVYVYRMDAILKNGEILMDAGNITLFR